MTHYVVMLRFEGQLETAQSTIEMMLDPYDENRDVLAYKKYKDAESIKRMAEHYNIDPTDLQALAKKMEDWDGYEGGVDEKGLYYLCTYNPDSKWDWWSLGGRWSGIIVLKDGAYGIRGESGVFDNTVGIDCAYLKDIDLEAIKEKQREEARQCWDKWIEERKEGEVLDPIAYFMLYGWDSIPEDGVVETDTVEKFAERCADGLKACAVLDKNGWHEASKMGWFGMDYDRTESKEEWYAKFEERFLSNPKENTIIAFVDCHI